METFGEWAMHISAEEREILNAVRTNTEPGLDLVEPVDPIRVYARRAVREARRIVEAAACVVAREVEMRARARMAGKTPAWRDL